MELDERKKRILAAVVELYIQTGEPVGSKLLCEKFSNAFSSATIRNEMAALSEMGLLEQPHTSAGRIPSYAGFRLYVNRLMKPKPLKAKEKDHISERLAAFTYDPEKLLKEAGALLAELTGCASLALSTSQKATVAKAEAVPFTSRNIMVLVVASDGSYRSKLCRTDFPMTPELLSVFSAFVKEHLQNLPLAEMTLAKAQSLSLLLGEHILTLSPLLLTACETAAEICRGSCVLDGQSNLLAYREFSPVAREIMELLSNPAAILSVLPHEGKGLSVLIGADTALKELQNSSLITTAYQNAEDTEGTLGVIGPIRMDYAGIIPHLEYLASIFGNLLSEKPDAGPSESSQTDQ